MVVRRKGQISTTDLHDLLKKNTKVNSIYQHLGTIGENRRPYLKHIFGDQNTIVSHKENGVVYELDLTKSTFSQGNSQLRRKLLKNILQTETVLDMFAAVGNLSLHIAFHKNIKLLAIEKDQEVFKYLEKNIEINGLTNVEPYNIDCRDFKTDIIVDRVFMGYHNITYDHFKVALRSVKTYGLIHLHPLIYSRNKEEELRKYKLRLYFWARLTNHKIEFETIDRVKKYSPNIEHYEVIIKKISE
jgi:tRNA wybutosine-synthesizing protein 2